MNADAFRNELKARLEQRSSETVLRILVSRDGSPPVELTGAELLRIGQKLAEKYVTVAPGSVVLLLMPHSVELFALHFGLILKGYLPAILAWPTNRIDPAKYQRNLVHQLRNLPAGQVLTLPRLAANMQPGLPYPVTGMAITNAEEHERAFAVPFSLEGETPPSPVSSKGTSPADALFLQFTGGTTGAQKCVVVTAPMLERQLARLADCLSFTPADGVVSWLPLYHDMGLIACLWLPLWSGAPSTQISASDWLLDPGLLFRLADRYRATFSWLPNFAFTYLAAQRERMQGPYSLQHFRAWINCSEPVRLTSIKKFRTAFADWGVDTRHVQASYAMAENVFAVTQTRLGEEPKQSPRSASPHRAGSGDLSFGLVDDVYVSSGRTLPGMNVRIRSEQGTPCADGDPGHIEIHTECLFSGYWGAEGFLTHAFSTDGWYSTGDFGFQRDGELYVIGRTKDIVIVGGQNVFPEDVESAVNSLPGVYSGRVVAFGVQEEEQGTEALAVVAEMRGDYEAAAAQSLQREISKLVLSTIGIAPRYSSVVPERWIVKSTAGKISRKETRERFLAERKKPKQGEQNGR